MLMFKGKRRRCYRRASERSMLEEDDVFRSVQEFQVLHTCLDMAKCQLPPLNKFLTVGQLKYGQAQYIAASILDQTSICTVLQHLWGLLYIQNIDQVYILTAKHLSYISSCTICVTTQTFCDRTIIFDLLILVMNGSK